MTIKEHKPDFTDNPTCRLINPSKSEIGIISKRILDDVNRKIIHQTKVNLWRITNSAITWFKCLPEEDKHTFITFDVSDFYLSISEELLLKALNYASPFTTITQQNKHVIIHAKHSSTTKTLHGLKRYQQHVRRHYGFVQQGRNL